MSIRDKILEYLKDEVLPENGVKNVSEIVDYRDEQFSDGYCETCYYEYYRLVVTYKDKNGKTKEYTHHDTLADLLRYA